jgi:preprotein translocase subunit YajC
MFDALLLIGAPMEPGAANPLISMLPFFLILIIFYFVLIRPQQQQVQKHKKFLESLKKGDEVVTDSGMFATILGVNDDSVVLRLGDNVKVKWLKAKIAGRVGEPGEEKKS